jgi:Na+-transporting methylmalonyl-CoA/oxaloacetate decarboxylase gamma subunit
MADYAISSANLNAIENGLRAINNNLGTLNNNLEVIDNNVDNVNNNVKVVYDEVGALARDFHDFVQLQISENNLMKAQQRIIQIRQEIEKRFGHYDIVRRNTTGILQADDLGIVKKDTISNATEELMISTPGYWLAPCLVALAAWINDQPELAERALREGIKRNDEKTSLFFALICRRADRKSAALKWTQRYLANQDEENLDRKTVIILDAFASGLLGADSEGVVSNQMSEWLEHLADKPGFVEQQTKQWSDAINLKRKPLSSDGYTYLRKYSKTWPLLQDIMEGAMLHAEILDYFTAIFEQEVSTDSLKAQLDEILNSLVSEFDDEEIPLRKEEKYNQFVIDFEGDEDRARQNMVVEETAFEEHKDFTQLLTDAAMKPESSHASVSTQKFAIALSKDWISNAYSDVVAQNRMKIPNEIEINVDTFNDKTTDGQNETELISRFNALVDHEKTNALAQTVLSGFEKFCLWGGAVIGGIGIVMIIVGQVLLGIIAIIAGAGMVINHFSKKKKIEQNRQNIEAQFEEKRTKGSQIIRATLAEVVDFRAEFAEKDGESKKVIDLLEQITPEQYVKKLSDSNRRIKVQ